MELDFFRYATYAFVALGIAFTAGFLSYIFTAIGKNVARLQTRQKLPKISTSSFMKTAAAACGAAVGSVDASKIHTITDGATFFSELIEEIREAEHSINITTYVWQNHRLVREILEELKQAAKRGVTVRLLIDGQGGRQMQKRIIPELEDSGVLVGTFRPFQIGKLSVYHSRIHRRAFVIDDRTAYIGGMAFADDWFLPESDPGREYTDTMYRVSGEPVLYIQHAFSELWASVRHEIIVLPEAPSRTVQESPPKENFLHLSHAPLMDVHSLTYLFWVTCAAAKKRIDLCSPYFIPGISLLMILKEKARSGVKVTLYLQGESMMPLTHMASRSYYKDLLESGVVIYEYKKRKLHTKVMVIDSHFSLVGSANCDLRSQRINLENVLGVQDDDFAKRHLDLFEEYRADSRVVTLEEQYQRSWLARLRDLAVSSISEQF